MIVCNKTHTGNGRGYVAPCQLVKPHAHFTIHNRIPHSIIACLRQPCIATQPTTRTHNPILPAHSIDAPSCPSFARHPRTYPRPHAPHTHALFTTFLASSTPRLERMYVGCLRCNESKTSDPAFPIVRVRLPISLSFARPRLSQRPRSPILRLLRPIRPIHIRHSKPLSYMNRFNYNPSADI